jgi:hypothetical protein
VNSFARYSNELVISVFVMTEIFCSFQDGTLLRCTIYVAHKVGFSLEDGDSKDLRNVR